MEINKEIEDFIKSFDFMRLGQAISNERWQSAAMIIQRMDRTAKSCGINNFEKQFTALRISINRKNVTDCKSILSGIINKRVQILKEIMNENDSERED